MENETDLDPMIAPFSAKFQAMLAEQAAAAWEQASVPALKRIAGLTAPAPPALPEPYASPAWSFPPAANALDGEFMVMHAVHAQDDRNRTQLMCASNYGRTRVVTSGIVVPVDWRGAPFPLDAEMCELLQRTAYSSYTVEYHTWDPAQMIAVFARHYHARVARARETAAAASAHATERAMLEEGQRDLQALEAANRRERIRLNEEQARASALEAANRREHFRLSEGRASALEAANRREHFRLNEGRASAGAALEDARIARARLERLGCDVSSPCEACAPLVAAWAGRELEGAREELEGKLAQLRLTQAQSEGESQANRQLREELAEAKTSKLAVEAFGSGMIKSLNAELTAARDQLTAARDQLTAARDQLYDQLDDQLHESVDELERIERDLGAEIARLKMALAGEKAARAIDAGAAERKAAVMDERWARERALLMGRVAELQDEHARKDGGIARLKTRLGRESARVASLAAQADRFATLAAQVKAAQVKAAQVKAAQVKAADDDSDDDSDTDCTWP